MGDTGYTILLILSLLFAAFFSGIEMAFISANKLQIELSQKQGELSGRILSRFVAKPAMLIGTSLAGYTLALVVFGIGISGLLYPHLLQWLPSFLHSGFVLVLLQTVIAAFVVLVVAEFVPRSFSVINPNIMLSVFAVPVLVLHYLLFPIVFFMVVVTKFIFSRILKWEYPEDKPVFALTDLNHYIKKRLYKPQQEPVSEVDSRIFHNALEFRTVKVRECMVPRTEIEAIDVAEGLEALRKKFIETGHSKIIVYDGTIDNIIGYCHQLALFSRPEDIRSILTPITVVPESMQGYELFLQFTADHRSIALVVDEFGGTSGIVTVEDVIEEIVGEIQDEYDEESLVEQALIEPDSYIFSARHEVDYLNEKYGLELPTGDYETLGGLILSVNEEIPQTGDEIRVPPYIITILSMDDIRINTVRLTRVSEEPKD